MKFKFLSLLFLSLSFMSFSQESETIAPNNKSKLTIGVYSGYLHNLNAYISTPDDNFTYDEKTGGFNYGAELGYFISKRFRPRLKLGYNQSSYYAYWLRSNITKTKVKLQKLELDLNFDYLIVNKSKFQFFASIGAVS